MRPGQKKKLKPNNNKPPSNPTFLSSLFSLTTLPFALLLFLYISDILIPPVPPPPPTHEDTLARLPFHKIWHLPLPFQLCFSLFFTLLSLSLSIPFFSPSLFSSPSFSQKLGWWGGFLVGMLGWGFRVWAKVVLAEYFTYQISVPDQGLITSQPYTHLIHPGYFGALIHTCSLMVMGVTGRKKGGMMGSVWGRVGMVVGGMGMAVGSICVRILEEERMLGEAFGERWGEHVAERWHLVPFVW